MIITMGWGTDPVFFAYLQGTLKRIGAFKGEGAYVGESATGQVLLRGSGGMTFEVTGIDCSIEALVAKLTPKKSSAGRKATRKMR